jgi:hypothetical protein
VKKKRLNLHAMIVTTFAVAYKLSTNLWAGW